MKVNNSNAAFSSIVSIGENLQRLTKENNCEYLPLNRGVNSVVPIDIKEAVQSLDLSSPKLLNYPPNSGLPELKNGINVEYFYGKGDINNIFITAGGMVSLDLIFQCLKVDRVYLNKFYWDSYSKICQIRNQNCDFYDSLDQDFLPNSIIVICDPNNPTGIQLPTEYLYNKIKELNDKGVIVVFDSPYRKIFNLQEDFFYRIFKMKNVIISESFSKSLGLSGMRIGFIHSNNEELNKELNIRILYSFNGTSAFSQLLVSKLLPTSTVDTCDMKDIPADRFKIKTAHDIGKNIEYLYARGFLNHSIYDNGKIKPVGIFAIVNMTEQFLLNNYIGSVSLDKFVGSMYKDEYRSFSRICVSVPHEKFVSFFDKI